MVNISSNLEITPSTYKEFTVLYKMRHAKQWCRRLHLIGTVVGAVGIVAGTIRADAVTFGASIVAGVGLCWAGDKFVENQVPTTFKYPAWSIKAHSEMVWSMIKGDTSV